jgi:hypothetical protein
MDHKILAFNYSSIPLLFIKSEVDWVVPGREDLSR